MKIEQAISALKTGKFVILPTETVYGLFADAMNEHAVHRLYAIKNRPEEKALNLNVSNFETILRFSKNQPVYLEKLVKAFLPGPLTLILEASKTVPRWVNSGKATIGFRMPAIPVTQSVIKEIDVLVGPSANLTGAPSPRFFDDLTPDILEAATVAMKDDSVYGLDTTILDLSGSPKILRQGAITREELLAAVPELLKII